VTPWAVRLPLASSSAAAALRLRAGITAAEHEEWLWLRGDDLDEELDLELRKLPGAIRYVTGPADTVTELGRRLPGGELPADVRWSPLSAWAEVKPQPAALGGEPPRRASLRLERVDTEQPANILVTTVEAFADYATAAPLVRLRPLRVAASSDGRAILRGDPLPPLPGRRYAERDGLAAPCGFGFSPALESAVLRRLLDLTPDDLALFHEDGSYERIDASSFARASRGTARATLAALKNRGVAG
jgi:hypothetical protein